MLTDAEVERFWSKVDKRAADECWPWLGRIAWNGYGKFDVGRGRRLTASRVAMQLELGRTLGGDELACHRCDNPACCNPAHLFVGSERDNRMDCIKKGRAHVPQNAGEKNPRATLTIQQVREIRALKGKHLQREIAAMYGVSRKTITAIHAGNRWALSS